MGITTICWTIRGGTNLRSCACGSWIKHWITYSGQFWPPRCAVAGCNNPPSVSGQVTQQGGMNEGIVPLCRDCNRRAGTVILRPGTSVASADKTETCEKVVRPELRVV